MKISFIPHCADKDGAPFMNQRGVAALLVILILAVAAVLPLAFQILSVSGKTTKQSLNLNAQAENVARAGLTEAIDWFRRRGGLVTTFNPAEPDDTMEDDIGLVREYEIATGGRLWGRVEVPIASVQDISAQKNTAAGTYWRIESRGYAFRRNNPTDPFNTANVVARSRMETEIRRLQVSLPTGAALLIGDQNNVNIQNRGRVRGGADLAVAYYTSGGPGNFGAANQCTGAAPITAFISGIAQPVPSAAVATLTVFNGVSQSDLQMMADVYAQTAADLPATYPTLALVYVRGNVTFDGSRPLRGGGILYVDGNMSISAPVSTNMRFSGLIFVTGNVSVTGPVNIMGSVYTLGSFTINGGGSGPMAEVEYDPAILIQAQNQIGQYREHKSVNHSVQGPPL